jgi:hypothetical protein
MSNITHLLTNMPLRNILASASPTKLSIITPAPLRIELLELYICQYNVFIALLALSSYHSAQH